MGKAESSCDQLTASQTVVRNSGTLNQAVSKLVNSKLFLTLLGDPVGDHDLRQMFEQLIGRTYSDSSEHDFRLKAYQTATYYLDWQRRDFYDNETLAKLFLYMDNLTKQLEKTGQKLPKIEGLSRAKKRRLAVNIFQQQMIPEDKQMQDDVAKLQLDRFENFMRHVVDKTFKSGVSDQILFDASPWNREIFPIDLDPVAVISQAGAFHNFFGIEWALISSPGSHLTTDRVNTALRLGRNSAIVAGLKGSKEANSDIPRKVEQLIKNKKKMSQDVKERVDLVAKDHLRLHQLTNKAFLDNLVEFNNKGILPEDAALTVYQNQLALNLFSYSKLDPLV